MKDLFGEIYSMGCYLHVSIVKLFLVLQVKSRMNRMLLGKGHYLRTMGKQEKNKTVIQYRLEVRIMHHYIECEKREFFRTD